LLLQSGNLYFHLLIISHAAPVAPVSADTLPARPAILDLCSIWNRQAFLFLAFFSPEAPMQQQYDTWISRQLVALECQISKSQAVAEDLMLRLKWYRELQDELIKRGKAHVLG
jgi:hypothetical protein